MYVEFSTKIICEPIEADWAPPGAGPGTQAVITYYDIMRPETLGMRHGVIVASGIRRRVISDADGP